MKHKILTFFLACLVPWLAGAQQSANSQNNVAEKDYIAYLFTYLQVTTSARKPYAMR